MGQPQLWRSACWIPSPARWMAGKWPPLCGAAARSRSTQRPKYWLTAKRAQVASGLTVQIWDPLAEGPAQTWTPHVTHVMLCPRRLLPVLVLSEGADGEGGWVGGGDLCRLTFKLSLESPVCKKIFVPFSEDPLPGGEWPGQEAAPVYPLGFQWALGVRGHQHSERHTPCGACGRHC